MKIENGQLLRNGELQPIILGPMHRTVKILTDHGDKKHEGLRYEEFNFTAVRAITTDHLEFVYVYGDCANAAGVIEDLYDGKSRLVHVSKYADGQQYLANTFSDIELEEALDKVIGPLVRKTGSGKIAPGYDKM